MAAAEAVRSGWVASGPRVAALEEALCERLGLPSGHVAACSSGTAALFLALRSLGARGKRVAVPVYACLALRNAVALAGAQTVLVDAPPGNPNVDRAVLRAAPADLAIPVSSFGIPVEDDAFDVLPAIDDACQALGASTPAGPAGTRGRAGVLSFSATKLITSGGAGGAVVSRDRGLIEDVRDYLAFDARDDAKPRFNLLLTDVGAAIGFVQLARLDEFLARRAEIWGRYRVAGTPLLDLAAAGVRCVRYRAVARDPFASRTVAELQRAGVGAIVPIEPAELVARDEDFPSAHELARTTISLPCFPTLTDGELETVVEGLARCAA